MIIINRHGLYLPTNTGLKRLSSLDELKEKTGNKKIVALVGPSLSYLEYLDLPADQTITDQIIESNLESKIPDEFNKNSWSMEVLSKDEAQKHFQVFAIEQEFLDEFENILAEKDIKISHYAPLSLAVTNLVDDDRPSLVIFIQTNIYFIAAKINGRTYIHHVDKLHQLKSDLASFIQNIESQHRVKIGQLYSFSDRNLDSLGLKIIELPINFSRLKSICALDPGAKTKTGFVAGKKDSDKKSPNNQLFKLLVFLILSIVALSFVWWWRFSLPKSAPVPEPTPTPTLSPSPSPEIIDPAQVSITVYNGTTTAGYAGSVAEILTEAGYTNVSTANNQENIYNENTIVTSNQLLATTLLTLLTNLEPNQVIEATTSPTATPSAIIYLEVNKDL